ncbi:MAG: prepilin-type N-terminal cleavage/methylation domain-containing protein [Acaryochloridaceae cyanobacterium SU_2_1]|nr:prepilin-type N-terminal cleavage/methylation domain-containing protein [Acaryochloridaceae cyanobacterium SU_2_1]NJM95177.1 prepilin-type N-terminal cleavage/methylation domain-containing protein [Acaryochloridaceae cyanobacterium CSU_5_19]
MPLKSHPPSPSESGFTLVEVLVGLVVVVAFVSTTMQALLTATLFRVKGQEISEATNWINQDLEMVKYKAAQLGLVAGTYKPDPTACKSSSYATQLAQEISTNAPVDANKSSAIGSRPYTLARTTTPSSASPNILEVSYTVTSASGQQISTRLAKVIPNVALACPD